MVRNFRGHLRKFLQERPQVEGDKQEVPSKEVRPQPLEYLVDTVGNPTTQKIIAGERLEGVYGVEVLSTRSPIVH